MSNGLELLTPAEMAKADRFAIENGISGFELMRRAGAAVARIAAEIAAARRNNRIAVLCGPGNNGGDGFIAARLLADRGFDVKVGMLGDFSKLRGDAKRAGGGWGASVNDVQAQDLTGIGVIVDALFGAGLARPIEGAAADLFGRIALARKEGARVVAVDLPSGINGANGAVLGHAVEADVTVTFFRRKPGHALFPGRRHCGRVHVEDIGISANALPSMGVLTFANAPALWISALPRPANDGNKYNRGHALVLSGGIEGCGAARLAARAALRVGAGLATLSVPTEALAIQAVANTAVMVRRADELAGWIAMLEDKRRNAVMIGPAAGVGEDTADKVLAALGANRAVVVDADGLTSFAGKPELLFEAIKNSAGSAVLTPHEGEFARLFHAAPGFIALGSDGGRMDKLTRARLAAQLSGAIVVLKGADTVIAAPDGRAAINENATPYLATAGSGDTLTGITGGLMAQSMPAWEAACAAVWLHAQAGASVGPGLIAEDLADALPSVLSDLLFEPARQAR